MFRQALSAMLMLILGTVIVRAQTPDLPLPSDLHIPPAASANADATAELADQVPHAAAATTRHAMPAEGIVEDCGCHDYPTTTDCYDCGHARPTWKEKCAYYRSVRQAFDRGPCCADQFGGFGPLWDSYCMDKQRCCADACGTCAPAPTPCFHCMPRPWPQLRRRPTNCCNTCDAVPAGCDCTTPAPGMAADQSLDIGQPPTPEPTEAEGASAGSAEPENRSAQPEKPASARRGWLGRTARWLPGR